MGYAWGIMIPADRGLDDPVTQRLPLTYCRIVRIGVKFPPGCADLPGVRLSVGGVFQLMPLNPDGWIRGNGEEVAFPYDFPLDKAPHELLFTGINDDERWPHTLRVRISIKKLEPGYEGFPTPEQIREALQETFD